jgi:hypothetical protein
MPMMSQHEHIGLDNYGSSWDECSYKVRGRNTPPLSYVSILAKSLKKKLKPKNFAV